MKLIIVLVAIIFAMPALAQQQPKCGYTLIIEASLQSQYGEEVIDEQDRPLREDTEIIIVWRVWVNQRTGSWTLTGTRGDVTCVFGGGLSGYSGKLVDDFLNQQVDPAGIEL